MTLPERPFRSILLPVMEAEPLVDPFRQDGDWSRAHHVPAHMTIAGPWPLSVALPLDQLAAQAQQMAGHRYMLSTVAVLGDAVCLFPEDDGPLMRLRSRLLNLAGYPDALDDNWRLHLTVCRDANTRVDEIRRALAASLPLPCTVRSLLLAEMCRPEDVRLAELAPQLGASTGRP